MSIQRPLVFGPDPAYRFIVFFIKLFDEAAVLFLISGAVPFLRLFNPLIGLGLGIVNQSGSL
jgi:hypothetical protein